jgi:phage protein U
VGKICGIFNLEFLQALQVKLIENSKKRISKYKLALLRVEEDRWEKGSTEPGKKKCKAIPIPGRGGP